MFKGQGLEFAGYRISGCFFPEHCKYQLPIS